MDDKAERRAARARRRTLTDERKDGAFHFSQIGFNAPLTLELRLLYGGSLSDPVPERMRDLLAQLSAPTD
jgi:hypothetical protein